MAISEQVRSSISKVYGSEGVLTILNGIRLERFWTANPEQKRAWRESHGVAPISTTFVCVARLSREKNIGEILQVLARREVAYHQAVLVIVGDGPLKKDLERQARELGCAHRCSRQPL